VKSKDLYISILTGACILYFGIVHAIGASVIKDVPIAFFPERSYEFQPVIEGTQVTHDFKIQNRGTAALLISNVRTG
jgi:hypothetical protein